MEGCLDHLVALYCVESRAEVYKDYSGEVAWCFQMLEAHSSFDPVGTLVGVQLLSDGCQGCVQESHGFLWLVCRGWVQTGRVLLEMRLMVDCFPQVGN